MRYLPVIGLEIHVQLNTHSKLFCSCINQEDDAHPNTNICPVCTGQPGALPVLNKAAVEKALLVGKALHCTIPDTAKFDRKNYYYPDLPKGYQISQYDIPVSGEGSLTFPVLQADAPRNPVTISITRAHMEDDAAKTTHTERGVSLVDYNRSGSPLVEIVTGPDFQSPAEARSFLSEMRTIMRTIGVSEADMEKGHMRCDANISLRRMNDDGTLIDHTFNPKVEVKNINSIKNVERALLYEIARQTTLFESGTPPMTNETRGWNDARGTTEPQRSKESAHDYRYFPEPDLPPLALATIRDSIILPELPQEKRERFQSEYGVSAVDARTLVEEPGAAAYFENVMSELRAWIETSENVEGTQEERWVAQGNVLGKLAAGWLLSKLWGMMIPAGITMKTLRITPEHFAEFLTLVAAKKINSTTAQTILQEMLESGKTASHILEERGLGQITEREDLLPMVLQVIHENEKLVMEYRAGKIAVRKALVGLVMKATDGRAHPAVAQTLLTEQLGEEIPAQE